MRLPQPAWLAAVAAVLAVAAVPFFVIRSTRERAEQESPVLHQSQPPSAPPEPDDHLTKETPFADRIDCNIVKLERLHSQDKAFVWWWTDGTQTRLNYPVDLYIDTRDAVDWRDRRTTVTVNVRSDTIRNQKFDRTLQFRAADLHRQLGGRGLIRILNVFEIDPGANVIHEFGRHTIHVTLKTESESYSGSAPFSITSSNPHSRE